tara:strand:- start:385 stop:1143 length:759 start_codon:yes stop_codon:yes gene_type:complete
MKFHFLSSNNPEAKENEKELVKLYGQNSLEEAEYIVPIGGDGLLLKSLHNYSKLNKPFFGINFGSIGFLMNNIINKDLNEIVNHSKKSIFKPLKMSATSIDNKIFEAYAYNEVSLMRQTHLASKIKIKINNQIKMEELICDGILLSTSAGSTAYNLSAHGSILPLDSNILALTPISAFRPRRWRGALLSEINKIEFEVIDNKNRSSSVTADNVEFRNISKVNIISSEENKCTVLFDSKHSIEDKILNEQFNF